MTGFRRPLAKMLNPLAAAGFVLEHLLEPEPVEAMADVNPERFATLSQEPCFVCIRARKP